MRALTAAIVMAGMTLPGSVGSAQPSATATARPAGYDRLGPLAGRWTYHGIGSGGRNESMSATYADGMLEFTAEAIEDGATLISRVRIGPFSDRAVPFSAESSADRVSWTVDASFTYVRLGDP